MDVPPTLDEQIDTLIFDLDRRNFFGKPSARRSGKNPRWPWVAVIDYRHPDLPRGGHTSVIRGRAYSTRDEAIAAAVNHINQAKAVMRAHLADPRYRALREQHGLPTIIPASTPGASNPADSEPA